MATVVWTKVFGRFAVEVQRSSDGKWGEPEVGIEQYPFFWARPVRIRPGEPMIGMCFIVGAYATWVVWARNRLKDHL